MSDYAKPILLEQDNFTPLTRTPWAGDKIIKNYKPELLESHPGLSVGESWEFSCDETFPSREQGTGRTLLDIIRSAPDEILGPGWKEFQGEASSEILVKLLDAGDNLSLQVHPFDDDPNLSPSECGKPESWYVLDVEAGAGIYLGFSKQIEPEALRNLLEQGDFDKELLQFVVCKPGDYFEIAPGVPHAIGAGITLLEPQRILPGRTGKTYRMWDWNRLYNKGGEEAVGGSPRTLHISESLQLVDSMKQVGPTFVNGLRREAMARQIGNGQTEYRFPANKYFQLSLVENQSSPFGYCLDLGRGYAIISCLRGSVQIGDSIITNAGTTCLLPNAMSRVDVKVFESTCLSILRPSWH